MIEELNAGRVSGRKRGRQDRGKIRNISHQCYQYSKYQKSVNRFHKKISYSRQQIRMYFKKCLNRLWFVPVQMIFRNIQKITL